MGVSPALFTIKTAYLPPHQIGVHYDFLQQQTGNPPRRYFFYNDRLRASELSLGEGRIASIKLTSSTLLHFGSARTSSAFLSASVATAIRRKVALPKSDRQSACADYIVSLYASKLATVYNMKKAGCCCNLPV